MRPDEFTVDLAPDGAATVWGIEQPVAEVWEPTPQYVIRADVEAIRKSLSQGWVIPFVIKVPTQSVWAGRGMPRGTAGAEFQVFTVKDLPAEQPARNLRLRVVRVCAVPLRKRAS